MDRDLFKFSELKIDGQAKAEGDIAFDDEPCAPPPAFNAINITPLN